MEVDVQRWHVLALITHMPWDVFGQIISLHLVTFLDLWRRHLDRITSVNVRNTVKYGPTVLELKGVQ